jgi:SagB-type dehydrogenase family enzyme
MPRVERSKPGRRRDSKEGAAAEYLATFHRNRGRSAPQWDLATSRFKLYPADPDCYIDGSTPSLSNTDGFAQLIRVLQESYGVTAIRLGADRATTEPDRPLSPDRGPRQLPAGNPILVRSVPSGGALYPAEMYCALRDSTRATSCLFHYDSLHERLNLVSKTDPFTKIATALDGSIHPNVAVLILLSCRFEKDAFKYQEFSYRVQSLDVGVLLGGLLASQPPGASSVHFLYDDRAINEVLGLDPMVESVYAVVECRFTTTLDSVVRSADTLKANKVSGAVSSRPALSIERWPTLGRLHVSAMDDAPDSNVAEPTPAVRDHDVGHVVDTNASLFPATLRALRESYFPAREQNLPYDAFVRLLSGCSRLAQLTLSPEGRSGEADQLLLYLVVARVDGLEPGIYSFDPAIQWLQPIRVGDFTQELQGTLANTACAVRFSSITVVPVANLIGGIASFGDRWYRVANMKAGAVVQSMYECLDAGFVCRPNLSFDVDRLDSLLDLSGGQTGLIQVFIGGRGVQPTLALPIRPAPQR